MRGGVDKVGDNTEGDHQSTEKQAEHLESVVLAVVEF